MAVIVNVVLRDVTPKQYDAVREEVGWIEQTPRGGLSHLTWFDGTTCHNIDAWESEEAFNDFATNRLGPALAMFGITAQPEVTFHSAHEVFVPRADLVTATPAASVMPATDNLTVVRGAYDAFARGDVAAVFDLFAPGIGWNVPDSVPFGGTYAGVDEVATFFVKLAEVFNELHVEPRSFLADGDTVLVIGHHRGRAAGGAAFEAPFAHVWMLSNGKAIAFNEHTETAKINAAIAMPTQAIVMTEAPEAVTR